MHAVLGEVCEFIRGVTFDKADVSAAPRPGLVPILRAGNIGAGGDLDTQNDLLWVPEARVDEEQMLRTNDIVICMSSGSPEVVGKTARAIATARMSVGSFCGIIRPRPGQPTTYLSYFFKSRPFSRHRDRIARGANIQNLRFSQFEDIEIAIPDDHGRVAGILARADRLRRIRRYAITLADTFLPAAFLGMFGDPKSSGGRWPLRPLGDVCERVTVGFVGTMVSEYVAEGVPLLRSLNVRRNRIATGDLKRISEQFHHRLAKSSLRPGDVVAVRTGKPGVSAVIPESLPVANCSDLIVMTCADGLRPRFLSELLNIALGDTEEIRGTTGAIQTHFNIERVKELRVPVPPVALQDKFVALAAGHERAIVGYREALRQADHLFQSLLHRAFTTSI